MVSALAQAPKPVRVLGLTTAAVFCALAAFGLTITLLGKTHQPGIVLDLPAPQAVSSASPAKPTPSIPASIPAMIDKAVYAGQALIADPALTEISSQGPLPRIAD